MSFYAIGFGRGRCRAACQEDIQAIMEFTGWSQNTVMTVFFIGIFLLLAAMPVVALDPPVSNCVPEIAEVKLHVGWDVPADRTDGTPMPISELARFIVAHGNENGALNISDVGMNTTLDLVTAVPGNYLVWVTAEDTLGQTSIPSEVATAVVPAVTSTRCPGQVVNVLVTVEIYINGVKQ